MKSLVIDMNPLERSDRPKVVCLTVGDGAVLGITAGDRSVSLVGLSAYGLRDLADLCRLSALRMQDGVANSTAVLGVDRLCFCMKCDREVDEDEAYDGPSGMSVLCGKCHADAGMQELIRRDRNRHADLFCR
jgi:hypothetical protein